MMSASPWSAGAEAELSKLLSDLDGLERLVETTFAPFLDLCLDLWPAPRSTGVGIAIGRLMAFRSEVKQLRASRLDLLTHRRRVCSVAADLIVLVEAVKLDVEESFGTALPRWPALMAMAFAVKQAAHAPEWPDLLCDPHGFIRPLTAAEAKRARRAAKRAKENPAACEKRLDC